METKDLTKEAQEAGIIPTLEDIKLGMACAIEATNRQVLVERIKLLVDSGFLDGKEGEPYLHVELSGEGLGCCGCSADYATEADVPEHSVPCTCGNPKHWLIKYDEDIDAIK